MNKTKERRVRIADCPLCKNSTVLDRKRYCELSGMYFNYTTCRNCFGIFDNSEVESRLERSGK